VVQTQPGKYLTRPYLKKPITTKGLVEWLKVLALSSSPSTTKKKKKKKKERRKNSVKHKGYVRKKKRGI
jgi:hypothetical protein